MTKPDGPIFSKWHLFIICSVCQKVFGKNNLLKPVGPFESTLILIIFTPNRATFFKSRAPVRPNLIAPFFQMSLVYHIDPRAKKFLAKTVWLHLFLIDFSNL